jgi:hypothetical protein
MRKVHHLARYPKAGESETCGSTLPPFACVTLVLRSYMWFADPFPSLCSTASLDGQQCQYSVEQKQITVSEVKLQPLKKRYKRQT